jgi:hypothetical protein
MRLRERETNRDVLRVKVTFRRVLKINPSLAEGLPPDRRREGWRVVLAGMRIPNAIPCE